MIYCKFPNIWNTIYSSINCDKIYWSIETAVEGLLRLLSWHKTNENDIWSNVKHSIYDFFYYRTSKMHLIFGTFYCFSISKEQFVIFACIETDHSSKRTVPKDYIISIKAVNDMQECYA